MKIDTEDLLTITDACFMFAKGSMSIYLWRTEKGMPFFEIPGNTRKTIRFSYKDLVTWSKKQNKTIVRDLAQIKKERMRTSKFKATASSKPVVEA